MKKARIMVAQNAEALETTAHALQAYDLVIAPDIQNAQTQLMESDIELFVVGIHFDDSRAIDLISAIRKEAKYVKTPIIVLRLLPTAMSETLKAVTGALIKVGIISEYVELEGEPDVEAQIGSTVEAYLPAQKTPSNKTKQAMKEAETIATKRRAQFASLDE